MPLGFSASICFHSQILWGFPSRAACLKLLGAWGIISITGNIFQIGQKMQLSSTHKKFEQFSGFSFVQTCSSLSHKNSKAVNWFLGRFCRSRGQEAAKKPIMCHVVLWGSLSLTTPQLSSFLSLKHSYRTSHSLNCLSLIVSLRTFPISVRFCSSIIHVLSKLSSAYGQKRDRVHSFTSTYALQFSHEARWVCCLHGISVMKIVLEKNMISFCEMGWTVLTMQQAGHIMYQTLQNAWVLMYTRE